MAKTLTSEQTQSLSHAVPYLIDFPASRFWVDYDRDADVLYTSFTRQQQATGTVMEEGGLLMRYRDGQVVGVTILDASTRLASMNAGCELTECIKDSSKSTIFC